MGKRKQEESSSESSSSEEEVVVKKSDKKKAKVEETPKSSKASKETKSSKKSSADAEPTEELVSPIASPIANADLTKKILKALAAGETSKKSARGIKDVSKKVRKGTKGVVILAANVSPMDIVSHLPVLCEDKSIPYVWISKKEELGSAGLKTANRSACAMFLEEVDDMKDLLKEIKKLHK